MRVEGKTETGKVLLLPCWEWLCYSKNNEGTQLSGNSLSSMQEPRVSPHILEDKECGRALTSMERLNSSATETCLIGRARHSAIHSMWIFEIQLVKSQEVTVGCQRRQEVKREGNHLVGVGFYPGNGNGWEWECLWATQKRQLPKCECAATAKWFTL